MRWVSMFKEFNAVHKHIHMATKSHKMGKKRGEKEGKKEEKQYTKIKFVPSQH